MSLCIIWNFFLIILNKNAHTIHVPFLSVTEFLDGKKRKKKLKTSSYVKQDRLC